MGCRAVGAHASQGQNTQVVIHKANQPDIIMHFFDADRLAGEDSTEVNLFATQTGPAAIGDDHDLVVEGIVDIGQSLIGAG